MKGYDVARTIEAASQQVWDILTDAAGYTSWDSGVVRVEGTIAAGSKIKVFSEISPGRAFPVKVSLDAPRQMVWTGGMPLGLFKGVRTFTLSSSNDGQTDFRMQEEFTGPLLKLIWRTMPDLTDSFEQFASGLKQEAEGS
ncbi:MAG: SRPBCC family protein [Acidimicrobiia bacterium]